MPNIWMDVDTALPEVPVNVMALMDDSDFKTREESVTFDQAGLDLVWNFVSTAGIHSQTAVTPTDTAGDYDWVNQGNGMYTIEIPLSGGGTINNDEEGFGWFSGFATGILPWVGPIIGFRAAALNNILVDTADSSGMPSTQAQVANIGSGATGGTHVEATYDNTTRDTIDNAAAVDKGGGLVGIPVTGHAFVAGREVTLAGTVNYNGAFEVISQTTNEVVITDTFVSETFGGSETIVSSIKGQIFVGTITSGTFADVSAAQGTLHSMDDVGDDIDIVYGFSIGGSRQATLIAVFANVNGNTDEMAIDAYDFVGDAFVPKKLVPGSGGTAFLELDPELISNNTGTGTEIGDVFVRFRNNGTTPSSLDIDKCLLTAVGTNVLIGYPNGFEIAVAGTSGTEFGVNGTAGNPCPFSDAVTMNAANPLNMFNVANGETVTLEGNSDGYSLTGEAWTLALAGRSIVNMHARGATVSGTSTGSGSDFHDCDMGTCTVGPCAVIDSRFTSKDSGGFTMQTAGDYLFHACSSRVAGNDAPVFTFPGSGNTFVSDRAGSGGRQYEGMSAGDLASVEGWGQFIEGTCSGGAVTIRGCLTLTAIINITITDEARFDVTQITGGAYALDTDNNGRMRIVDGTGTGELNTDGGRVESDLVYIHGGALTETPGQLATRFTAFFDQAASTFSVNTALSSFKATGFSTHTAANVWAVDATGEQTQGTFGQAVGDPGATAKSLWQGVVSDAAGASVSADVIAIKTDTGNLVTRITATLFSGITSLAEWLGLIAGKQIGNATARTEIRATGAGSGTFDETIDSGEATRDRGDSAWITATGFNTVVPPSVAQFNARTLVAASYFDPAADTVVNVTTVGSVTTKTGYALTAAERNSIADALLQRDVDNVEATANEHTLCTVILAILESAVVGTTWTIKRTDGSTTHATKTVTVDASADPITAVT